MAHLCSMLCTVLRKLLPNGLHVYHLLLLLSSKEPPPTKESENDCDRPPYRDSDQDPHIRHPIRSLPRRLLTRLLYSAGLPDS